MPRRPALGRRHPPMDHALFEPLEARQLFASIAWDGGGDGTTLNQAANWAGDVLPGASDDAVVNVAGSPTLSMSSGTFGVNSLTCAETFNLSGGTITIAAASAFSGPLSMVAGAITGAGDLNISGTFAWSGGVMSGSGTTTLAASTVTTITGISAIGLNRNIVNAGTLNWNSSQLGGVAGSPITFTNNGTITANLTNPYSLAANSTPSTFVNNGTFTKAGPALLTIDGFIFNSTGPVDISAGTLKFAAGGSMSGTMTVSAGATLNQGAGTFAYSAAATLAGTGAWLFTAGSTSFDNAFTPAGSITASGGTLTLNAASQTLPALTLSGGVINGAGDLTITNSLTWSSGTFGGSGLLTIAGAATATVGGGGQLGLNRNVTNAGTFNWVNGTLGALPGPGITFTNNSAFNVNLGSDAYFYGNTTASTFINHGTVHKLGGNVLTFTLAGLVNASTVQIDAGSMVLSAGGGLGGTFTIAAGTFLDCTGGAFDDAGCTLNGAGTARFLGGVHTLSGTLTDNVPTTLDNSTLGGPGNITINAPFDWTNGTMNGTGTTTVSPGITLQIESFATKNLGRTLTNNGRIEHSLGYLQLNGNGTLNNSAGHTYNMTQTADLYSMGSGNSFNNAGTFNSHTTADPFVTCPFNNSGTLNIFTGTFDIDGGGTNSGPRNIAAGAQLRYHASYTHAAGSTTLGSGLFILNGGTHTISGDWTIGCFSQLLTGTLTGPGNLTTNGPLSWGAGTMTGPGSIIIGQAGKLAIVTAADHTLARNIVNHGQLHDLNGSLHVNGTTITSDGTFAILPYGTIGVLGGVNTINNSGVIRKMSSAASSFDSAAGGITLNNTGLVDVRNGTLNLNGPITQISGTTLTAGSWQVYPTGTLGMGSASIRTIAAGVAVTLVGGNASLTALSSLTTNNGTLDLQLGGIYQLTPVGGTFTNNGTITLSPDRWLQVNGNFVQSAPGTLAISLLDSTRYSRVNATGSETLGGTVTFNFVNAYVPTSGAIFDFLHTGNRISTFATATIPAIPGHAAQVSYQSTGARLSIS